MGVLRWPPQETDLYPNLLLTEERMRGAITVGESRLPVWALVPELASPQRIAELARHYGVSPAELESAVRFLSDLTQAPGELGRLLLVIAEAKRQERRCHWYETRARTRPVLAQLARCERALHS